MAVTRALHCNLNVRALEPAVALYEDGLGLRTLMRTGAEGTDNTALGIDVPTHSSVAFLYDHRGGRVAPALEIMEWETPATLGETYTDPAEVGMQAIGFTVPSIAEAGARLGLQGAFLIERRSAAVDAVVLDVDGVALELHGDPSAAAASFDYLRLNCADLDRSVAWYEAIGLTRVDGDEGVERWKSRGLTEGDAAVPCVRLGFGDGSGFELRLSTWPGTDPRGRAHRDANHRGLFRMALAVEDVRAAAAEAAAAGMDVGEPTYIELPGTPLGGLWVAFLRDPDGVMVEFVERPESAI